MKKVLTFLCALFAAVQTWASLPTPIAQITIGENTTDYMDAQAFASAVKAVEGAASVKICRDMTCDLSFENSDDVSIDLNGYTITGKLQCQKGKMTINDSSDDQTGRVFGEYKALDAESDVVINGGTFEISEAYSTVASFSSCKLVINGGTFKGGYNAMGIYLCDVIINGGSFATQRVLVDGWGCNVTLNGGTFTKGSADFMFEIDGSIEIGKGYAYRDAGGENDDVYYEMGKAINYSGSVVYTGLEPARVAIATVNDAECYSAQTLIKSLKNYGAETIALKLLADVKFENSASFSPVNNVSYTIDLNGHTLTGSLSTNENVSLTVGDASDDEEGKIVGKIYCSGGTLTINNGTFENNGDVVYVSMGGNATIDDGKFTGRVYCSGGTLTINNGTFENKDEVVYVSIGGNATINGGAFTSSENKALYVGDSNTEVTIKGGTFSGATDCLSISNYVKCTIDGGEFFGKNYAVYGSSYNDLIINDGNFSSDGVCLSLAYGKKTVINGGEFIGKNYAINGSFYDDLIIIDGKFSSDDVCLSLAYGKKTVINGGEFIGKNYAINGSCCDDLIINDGKFSSDDVCVRFYYGRNETTIINGGEFTAPKGVTIEYCTVSLNGGTYNTTDYAFELQYGAAVTLGENCVYRADGQDDLMEITENVAYSGKVVNTLSSSPTAIGAINAGKSAKSVKTVENGRVVIISNGVRHDVAGRKL